MVAHLTRHRRGRYTQWPRRSSAHSCDRRTGAVSEDAAASSPYRLRHVRAAQEVAGNSDPARTGVYQSERAPIRRARTLVPPRTEDDLARPNAARHRRSGRLAGCSRQAAPAAPAHRIGDFDPAIRGAPVTNSPCRRSSRRSPSTCSCTASPPPGNAPVLGDSGPAAPAAGAVLLFCVQPKTKEPEDEEFHEHTVGAPVLGTDVALPRIVALTATPPRAGPHAGYYLTS